MIWIVAQTAAAFLIRWTPMTDIYFAYFIGGSRDLSKMAIEGRPEEILVPVFTADTRNDMALGILPDKLVSADVETYYLAGQNPFDPKVLFYAFRPEEFSHDRQCAKRHRVHC